MCTNTKKERVLLMHNSNNDTMTFSLGNEQEIEIRRALTAVYDALKEKGYNVYGSAWGGSSWFTGRNVTAHVDMIKQGRDAELNSHWFYANHHFINDINAKFINTLNPVGVYVPNNLIYHRAAYTYYYKENVSDYYFSHKRLSDTLVSEEVGNVKVCVNTADDWYYEIMQDEDL